MAICLKQSANDLHVVQLIPLPPRHLLFHYWFVSDHSCAVLVVVSEWLKPHSDIGVAAISTESND